MLENLIQVGVTFSSLIWRAPRDTLILFFAPWCGFCKSILPLWDELALSFLAASVPITVARFDVSQNHLPSNLIKVVSVPAICFVFADNQNTPDSDDNISVPRFQVLALCLLDCIVV